jgi:hypothetical protein
MSQQRYYLTDDQLAELEKLLVSLHQDSRIKELILESDQLSNQIASCNSLLDNVASNQHI